jgi:hypothetical protein
LVVVECAGCDKGFVVCEVGVVGWNFDCLEVDGNWWNLVEVVGDFLGLEYELESR